MHLTLAVIAVTLMAAALWQGYRRNRIRLFALALVTDAIDIYLNAAQRETPWLVASIAAGVGAACAIVVIALSRRRAADAGNEA